MARREETFLESRSRMKRERETQPDQYAKSLSAGRDRAAKSSMIASSRTLSASKGTGRPQTELTRQMEEHRSRIEGRNSGKESQDRADAKRNRDKNDAKAARDQDAKVRFDTKASEKADGNMKALMSVFKESSDRIIAAIKKGDKDQLDALKRLRSNGGIGGGDGSLFDLLDDADDSKGRKGGKSRARRIARVRARATARGARGFGRRALTALEEGGGRLADTGVFGRGLSAIKGVGSKALGYGSRAMGAVSSAGSRIMGSLGEAAAPIMEMGSKGLGAAGKGLGAAKSALGSVGGIAKAAGPLAILAGGYDVYNTVTDDSKTGGEKAQGVANIAGGTAGGMLGAELGAAVGTAIFPVVGTAVGGIVGGVAGYFGGEKFISSIGGAVTSTLADSGVGEALGKTAAVAMAPFSQDARDALAQDWQKNILPAMTSIMQPVSDLADKMKDYTAAFEDAAGQVVHGVGQAASSMWQGMKNAGGRVADGYSKGGIGGFFRSLTGAAGDLRQGASKGYGEASDAVKLAGKTLGAVSEKYESGGRGAATISNGKGDAGGVSYGKYQLATNNGSMSTFLKSKEGAPIAAQLQGLQPGTQEFNDKYKQLTQSPDGAKSMEDAQHAYIQRTHFEPQAAKLQAEAGLDVSKRGKAVQEAVWSTSVQYGKDSDVITKALKGKDASKMSDTDLVSAIQDYKAANVDSNFQSSSGQVRDGVRARIDKEKQDLVAISNLSKDGKPIDAGAKSTPMGMVDPAASVAANGKNPKMAELRKRSQIQGVGTTDDPKLATRASMQTDSTATQVTQTVATADARSSPVPMVDQSTPTEPMSMTTIAAAKSAPAVQSGDTTVINGGGGGESSQPSLSEVPMYINDMGLVLLNIGHV